MTTVALYSTSLDGTLPLRAMATSCLAPPLLHLFLFFGHYIAARLDLADVSSCLDHLKGRSVNRDCNDTVWMVNDVRAHTTLHRRGSTGCFSRQYTQILLSDHRKGHTRGICDDLRLGTSPIRRFGALLGRDIRLSHVPPSGRRSCHMKEQQCA